MVLLVIGVLLWAGAHLFKRIAPTVRAGLGNLGKGLVAVLLLASIALMVLGYQQWPLTVTNMFWGRHPATAGINNLLVLLAFYLMVASVLKPRVTGIIRHPQLTAVKAWALGHLLVNGDIPSLVLFGGLLAWAVVEVILINKQDGKPQLQVESSFVKEAGTVVVTAIVFGGVAHLHAMWGYPVFG